MSELSSQFIKPTNPNVPPNPMKSNLFVERLGAKQASVIGPSIQQALQFDTAFPQNNTSWYGGLFIIPLAENGFTEGRYLIYNAKQNANEHNSLLFADMPEGASFREMSSSEQGGSIQAHYSVGEGTKGDKVRFFAFDFLRPREENGEWSFEVSEFNDEARGYISIALPDTTTIDLIQHSLNQLQTIALIAKDHVPTSPEQVTFQTSSASQDGDNAPYGDPLYR